MNLNNRDEVTCSGFRTRFRKRLKVLATLERTDAGQVKLLPCDGSEPIGPYWDWVDALPELCRRVCGKCPSRRSR